MSEINHDFLSEYSKGELGVQLLKRLVVNGISENLVEFLSLEDAHGVDSLKVDKTGVDCYLETKQDNIYPVQVKTEYAVNCFIELVSQVHLNSNKTKNGWALDVFAKSDYTYFINYSNGVAVANSKNLRTFLQDSLANKGGDPIFNGMKYPLKKAWNYNVNGTNYISIGVPVNWDDFLEWDCVDMSWDWDKVLDILKDDKDGIEIIEAMQEHHLSGVPPQGKSVEVEERRKNTDS